MIPELETFDGTWPFAPHYFEGNRFRQHYIDEPGDGAETIVCLHGEPTWGYLYRAFIPRLARYGRVIVPDHMGFGKSETPQDRTYSIREHVDNLEALLQHLEARDITFVAQDWGGPIATMFALRHPELVKRLCFMNTGVPGRAPADAPRIPDYPWYQWVHTEESQVVLSNLGATILSVLKRIGFERTAHVDETWIRAYASAFPTAADCKGALAFPASIGSQETVAAMLEHMANLPALAAEKRGEPAFHGCPHVRRTESTAGHQVERFERCEGVGRCQCFAALGLTHGGELRGEMSFHLAREESPTLPQLPSDDGVERGTQPGHPSRPLDFVE